MKSIFNEAFEILYQALPNFLAIVLGSLISGLIFLIFVGIVGYTGLFYASGHTLRDLPYYISEYFGNLRRKLILQLSKRYR